MNANELADELFNYLPSHDAEKFATMLRQQQAEIEYWKEKFNKAMAIQEKKPAKYSNAWWKEVEEFNNQLRAQKK
jgi:hypothetical protein